MTQRCENEIYESYLLSINASYVNVIICKLLSNSSIKSYMHSCSSSESWLNQFHKDDTTFTAYCCYVRCGHWSESSLTLWNSGLSCNLRDCAILGCNYNFKLLKHDVCWFEEHCAAHPPGTNSSILNLQGKECLKEIWISMEQRGETWYDEWSDNICHHVHHMKRKMSRDKVLFGCHIEGGEMKH